MISNEHTSEQVLSGYSDWERKTCLEPFARLNKRRSNLSALIVMGGSLRGLNHILDTSRLKHLSLIEQSENSIKLAMNTVS